MVAKHLAQNVHFFLFIPLSVFFYTELGLFVLSYETKPWLTQFPCVWLENIVSLVFLEKRNKMREASSLTENPTGSKEKEKVRRGTFFCGVQCSSVSFVYFWEASIKIITLDYNILMGRSILCSPNGKSGNPGDELSAIRCKAGFRLQIWCHTRHPPGKKDICVALDKNFTVMTQK